MSRVMHFEIHADDPERAASFYRDVFDWQVSKWEGPVDYWLAATGPDTDHGINGAIMHRRNGGSVWNTIDVPSLDDAIAKTTSAGGKVVQPKTTVPGVGYMAYCADTEGNVFGLMQADESAA